MEVLESSGYQSRTLWKIENKLGQERRIMQTAHDRMGCSQVRWATFGVVPHCFPSQLLLLKGGLFCAHLDLTTSIPLSCPQSYSSCTHCILNFLGTYSTPRKSRTQPRLILAGFRALFLSTQLCLALLPTLLGKSFQNYLLLGGTCF